MHLHLEGGGGLGPGLEPEGCSSAFSLHFRSLMSLPSTSTPPTPSAQVSVKPTCICLGFYTWPTLWAEGGQSTGFCPLLPSPTTHACSERQMRKELGLGVRQSWIQGQQLPFPGCVTLEKSLHLSGSEAFASSPAPGRCDACLARLTLVR